ncbi:LysR family transcriptional regulator [Sinomonas notoginsengisoli]|uniref:LysR family transcriptional regulator n=1 Tax=Sinomonas notoginsengisoli TaxID=1457311 RepID=UPI001F318E0B|nr:LysR family transcriptional regulator [Sinomonas notoginsengisoli]
MDTKRLPSPDDLLILLTVARLGRFTAVAEALGTTHTTVSRRILALDKSLGGRTLERTPHGWELTELGRAAVAAAEGIEKDLAVLATRTEQGQQGFSGLVRIASSDAFGAYFAAPALADLQRRNPLLRIELLSATRRASQNRSGVDLEVVAGAVERGRSEAIHLCDYALRLYASPRYLQRHAAPQRLEDLRGHSIVSYVESALQIAELGLRVTTQSDEPAAFQATSVFAQLEAVRNNAGIGKLPAFMVHGQEGFVQVLSDEVDQVVGFWVAARPEALRSARVQAVLGALRGEVERRQGELLP